MNSKIGALTCRCSGKGPPAELAYSAQIVLGELVEGGEQVLPGPVVSEQHPDQRLDLEHR